eukprot:Hpha_TRINITY_DN31399_c0_g1::TRINITY_DN31399_c0_g1_i1::g.194558::m.194558
MFISQKLTEPGGTFSLDSKLSFRKIKVTDVTFSTNALDPSINNVLVCLDKYSTNQFIFQNRLTNPLNTLYLVDVPVIQGTRFSYNPVNMYPPDFEDEETQHTRTLKFQIKKDDGTQISTAEWGSSVIQLIM